MKTQINEVKRMQQLAGILTEAQSPAEALANEYGIPEYIDKSSIDYKSSDEGWSIEFKMNIPKNVVRDMDNVEEAEEYFKKHFNRNYYAGPGAEYVKISVHTEDRGNVWVVEIYAHGGLDI